MKSYPAEHVIVAFLTSRTNVEVSERTGLSLRTVTRYKHDPEFIKVLRERRTAIVQETVNHMSTKLSCCAETLLQIINDPSIQPQTRVYAVSVFAGLWRDWNTQTDILSRLNALEAISEANNGV